MALLGELADVEVGGADGEQPVDDRPLVGSFTRHVDVHPVPAGHHGVAADEAHTELGFSAGGEPGRIVGVVRRCQQS